MEVWGKISGDEFLPTIEIEALELLASSSMSASFISKMNLQLQTPMPVPEPARFASVDQDMIQSFQEANLSAPTKKINK